MYNKSILIGRLTADPELRTTPNGVNVAAFRIAVNRAFAREKADFIPIVTWRNTAEFVCRYFKKGKPIGVEGAIQTRDYTDDAGNRHYAFEIVAERVFFVGGKDDTHPSGTAAASGSAGDSPAASSGFDIHAPDDEDLPF